MMTSTQVRQSFLDFFKSKSHTIVASSSLMPDSPNLLFTNAGMNQFVPIFLGQTQCPYTPGRAADTQKCIRAGGKHNDLDDVGLDTYHHTFFEMLGNWSFGDYFKRDAINWAWELVIEVWKFPPQRVYATVFCPHMNMERWQQELNLVVELAKKGIGYSQADELPGESAINRSDREAASLWAKLFLAVGLDPLIHVVPGNKKDNFWMMGETGPCGPCTEIHVDLRPGPVQTDLAAQISGALLVNGSDARCIEIWNNVFIQYNAQPVAVAAVCDRRADDEGERRSQTAATIEFVPLAAQHVDTGMGFERVTSIIQGTKNLTDFQNAKISNYETDIFRPIFDVLEKMSGKTYRSTLPSGQKDTPVHQKDESIHLKGESVHTKDELIHKKGESIQPQDELVHEKGESIHQKLEPVHQIGELVHQKDESVLKKGESIHQNDQIALDIAFRVIADHIRTLSFAIADGIQPGNTDRNYVLRRILRRAVRYGRTLGFREPFFYKLVDVLADTMGDVFPEIRARKKQVQETIQREEESFNKTLDRGIEIFEQEIRLEQEHRANELIEHQKLRAQGQSGFDESYLKRPIVSGDIAFTLYDTFGFPLDLTELMARERGLTVDKEGFEKLMEEQRARARAAQKKEVISLSQIETTTPTKFVGFDHSAVEAKVLEVVSLKDKTAVILDATACYAEMGGQVGDTGELTGNGQLWRITNTQKSGNTFLHFIEGGDAPVVGAGVTLAVEKSRRDAIQRHHTVTHLLHWALHEVASKEASQKGSFVGPDKLTFDFNSAPLTPVQVADIERLVNERILDNAGVSWTEVAHADVKNRKDVMQFFGDKYGDTVRVVQIGGGAGTLDGYSMELCGGTHTRATGEIGLFRIVSEAAVAAGVRRIEAVAGLSAYDLANQQLQLIRSLAGKINSPIGELEKKVEAMLAHQKELEKSLRTATMREASNAASELLARVSTVNGTPAIIHNVGGVDGDFLQAVVDSLKGRFAGVIVLGGAANGAVALVAAVSSDFTAKIQAGKIIQAIAPIVGGKGGGKPDNARGGGKDATKLDEALAKAKSLLA